MKKASLLAAALIGLGLVSQASADTVVYMTGSTAFRSSVYGALTTSGRIFDAPGFDSAYLTNGTSASGCNFMLFHGKVGGSPTYIDCAWSGSEAGMASGLGLTFPTINNDGAPLFGCPETWLKADGSLPNTGITVFGGGAPAASTLEASSHQADCDWADTSVASGLPAILAQNAITPLKSYGQVGIVTFTWVKNSNSNSPASSAQTAWSRLTNISTLQAQDLMGTGERPADEFTGNFADDGTPVYLVGRNKGSGTRANVLNDSTYGLNTAMVQFNVGGGLTTSPSGLLSLDINGGTRNPDPGVGQDDGYESGGNVSKALSIPGSTAQADATYGPNGWIAVGYLGVADAQKNGLSVANNWLTENGVLSSDGAIENAQFSYWGYENFYGRPNIGGTAQDTVAQAIFTGVQTQIANDGSNPAAHDADVANSFMNCVKASDFAFPSHN